MIATFECEAKEVVAEKHGTNKSGGEYHRMDILCESGGGPHSRPSSLVVTFYSNDGPLTRLPSMNQHIRLTVAVSASAYNGKWYNNVKALEFEEITPP